MYPEKQLRERHTENQLRERTKATECVFGLVGNGFAIVAVDASTGNKFSGPATTMDKIMVFDSHKLIGAIGHCGDRQSFTNIKKQAQGFSLTIADTASFIRQELAATTHRFKKSEIKILFLKEAPLAGVVFVYDLEVVRHDWLITMAIGGEKGAFGGDGSSYSISAMDNSFHVGMSLNKAIDLVDACIEEIRSCLDVGTPTYIIKIVDEQGARHYAWRKPHYAWRKPRPA